MRVLVATSLTNGDKSDDYNWCIEGEIVTFGVVCDRDMRGSEDSCGCGRGFSGLSSHRATTTAMVRDSALSEDDVTLAIESSLSDGSWLTRLNSNEARAMVADTLDLMADVADYYDDGTVIGKTIDGTFVRRRSVTTF